MSTKTASKTAHPDVAGGSNGKMLALNAALADVLKFAQPAPQARAS